MMDNQTAALTIIQRLAQAGHIAYYAGGWVRDHLMGHDSNDIDIATSALPDQILDLFPRTILVGLSFGVVIVLVEGKQFEVATFRKDMSYADGRRPEEVEFSSAEEDAKRRDFTINGMFYDPLQHIIHDFVGGAQDIKKKVIRAIGNPYERFIEDRLRMVRAVRFAARFDFVIDPETREAIIENADTLFPAVAMERIWQEFCKVAETRHLEYAIPEMHILGLLQVIFPDLRSVGLHVIRQLVAPFRFFPEDCPPILYFLELFPQYTLEQQVEMCRYLKISNRDIKLVELMSLALRLVSREKQGPEMIETWEWVYFYAHPDAFLCLRVIAASYSEEDRICFLKWHEERKCSLSSHIERVQLGRPLITAALLQAHGVSPGKPMGVLLKQAERMVINHNRQNAEEIIEYLKKSSDWPSGRN